ncbi:hypothetical protein [Brevibacillus sp. HD3.3A]|uniref:hypothetical protein n=1 Tax=Brevibacillus sp. HD3.3A TaxID=2738979 RepID=UPI00156B6021|nr:hypothetical protein [Brevibacillus sp. HD3.3A]UED72151.1 hypothetical protein HP435_29030 [Brevibacillus sp. HD3.3A]
MNALKLAGKVQRIIDRHIRKKGYEVEVILETPKEGMINRPKFSLEDDGTDDDGNPIQMHQASIKVVITGHKIDEDATPIGDNPVKLLDFIVIDDTELPQASQVEEGRFLVYNGERYNIILVSPASLAGILIIKECQARSVK